jgi:endoglucanase
MPDLTGRTVKFTIHTSTGAPLRNTKVKIRPEPFEFRIVQGIGVVPEEFDVITDAKGQASIVIIPGNYGVITSAGMQTAPYPGPFFFECEPDTAPILLDQPVIKGPANIGSSATVDPGRWQKASGFSYQWMRDGDLIPGADDDSYTPVDDDDASLLSCVVTARNEAGSTEIATAAIPVTHSAPRIRDRLGPVELQQGAAPIAVNAADAVEGRGLSWSLISEKADTVDQNGVVRIWTGDARTAVVQITARNSGGSVSIDLMVTVSAAVASPEDGVLPLPALYGVNLAGAEFADNEYWPDNKFVDYYSDRNFNFVRLPFKWARLQPDLFGPLAEHSLAQMHRIVSRATERGMWVALDMHNYMRRSTQSGATDIIGKPGTGITNAHFADAWARLAEQFKDNPRVLFNLMNEPYGIADDQSAANQIIAGAQNAAAAAIRATGANNCIMFSTNHYSGAHHFIYSEYQQNLVLMFEDPGQNWVLDLHQYLDPGFGGTSVAVQKGAGGIATLGTVTEFMRANGIRAILGEFNAGPSPEAAEEVKNHLAWLQANADVWAGWAWWLGGQGSDNSYYDSDPYILDPLSLVPPIVDKPQMAMLQTYIPQDPASAPFAPVIFGVEDSHLRYLAGAGAATTEISVNDGAWSEAAESPAALAGIIEGTENRIRVRSINTNGPGPVAETTFTPVRRTFWTRLEGAVIDHDFENDQHYGADPLVTFDRPGGHGDTRSGLLLAADAPADPIDIRLSSEIRTIMEGPRGYIYMEADGMDGGWGGFLIRNLIRVNALHDGRHSFRTLAATGSWQGVNVASPSGGPGSRQVIVYAWDVDAPAGERAYISVSGGVPVSGSADEPHMVDLARVGSLSASDTQASVDALATASYPAPRLKRFAVGTAQPSRAQTQALSAKTAFEAAE